MASLAQIAGKCYGAVVRVASHLQPVFLLVIRLYWGWQFFVSGKAKLLNIKNTASFFEDLHIPMPTLNAYLAGASECFGGLFLLLGVASRLSAIPLIVTMLVAYATANPDELHAFFSDPDAFVKAPPFLFLMTCVIVLLFGPGLFSVDGVIKALMDRHSKRRLDPGPAAE
jgi:putative oxidoreductase